MPETNSLNTTTAQNSAGCSMDVAVSPDAFTNCSHPAEQDRQQQQALAWDWFMR